MLQEVVQGFEIDATVERPEIDGPLLGQLGDHAAERRARPLVGPDPKLTVTVSADPRAPLRLVSVYTTVLSRDADVGLVRVWTRLLSDKPG